MNEQAYVAIADELTQRILNLIPENPKILDMDDPWDLFKVDDFNCDDLGPSLFQASWSLAKAKQLFRENDLPIRQ